jgi:spore germination protein YaaH
VSYHEREIMGDGAMTAPRRFCAGKRRAASTAFVGAAFAVNACAANVASPAPAPASAPATAVPSRPSSGADLQPTRVWAFTAPWDARSDSSLREHEPALDVAITGWIQLDSLTGAPTLLYPDDSSSAPGPMRRFALVTSWHGRGFHPNVVRQLGSDGRALGAVASRLGELVSSAGYTGVVLDLEEQSAADTGLTARVVGVLADSVRAHGASTVAVAIPAADTAAYPTRAFVPAADFAVVMLYDEHWSTSAPGPIATPDWVRRTLGQRIADVGVDHIVAALPLYSYLWQGNRPAEPLSFAEAQRAAAGANVEIARDPASQSLHAIQPGVWDLWSSDAELLRALRSEVAALGVTRIALWRLGQEDPAVWPLIARWSARR